MVLGQQECCCGGVALSVLINKDKATLAGKNNFLHSGCCFKRQGQGFEGYLGAKPARVTLSNFHKHKLSRAPDPLLAQSCVWGMKKRNYKDNERSYCFKKSSDLQHLYFPFSFQHALESSFPSCIVCTPEAAVPPRHTPAFPPAHVWSCSHLGLDFNPLLQADELHEPSSAGSSWLSSFCLAFFIVWALNVPALPSAHTFGFWLMRGSVRDSVCHLESSMTWSQVVTQIPQTVHRIDHKFLQ